MLVNKMVETYTLNDDGTYFVSELTYSELSPAGVFIVVDINTKRLHIWKGSEAPVRQKFISARVAQDIRLKEYGMAFKVETHDQGEEMSSFLTMFGVTAEDAGAAVKPTGPVVTASPGSSASKPVAAARPAAASKPVAAAKPAADSKPVAAATPVASSPAPAATARSPPPRTSSPAPAASAPRADFQVTASATQPDKALIDLTLEKLKELDEPEGMQREIVIIGNTVYSAHKEYHKLFKKEIVKLESFDDLPNGAFPANDYYARLFMEDGKVLFIELFSETPASAREEFLADMRSSLRDLTKLGI